MIAWLIAFGVGLEAMFVWPEFSTIPFHGIWLSFTVLYGVCAWRRTTTLIGAGLLFAGTLAVLLHHHANGQVEAEELGEVPLMLGIFLTVAWQVARHRRLTTEMRALADDERQLRMRQLELAQRSSHEIRTPLTVARGHLDFVRLGVASESELAADVSTAIAELDRIALISKGLLTLARVEGLGLSIEEIEPMPFLEAVLRRWSPCTERRWVLDSRCGTFRGDVERLTTAVDALIDNACRHTPQGSPIELRAVAGNGTVELSVGDRGPGIPDDALPRVFDAFWQAVRRQDRRYSGTGLGLAIVQSVAGAHGGVATAANVAGGGAVFTLVLPDSVVGDAPPQRTLKIVEPSVAMADSRLATG